MRFLLLTQYFAPETGACPVRLLSMARSLVDLGHEVEVVTAMPNHPTGRVLPDYRRKIYMRDQVQGITVHRVCLYVALGAGAKRLLNYASFACTAVLGLSRARRPDFVFVESPPLFLGITGVAAATIWHVPLILNVSDLWPDSVRQLGIMREGLLLTAADALESWLYRKAAFVTAVTEGIRVVLTDNKGLCRERVLFLPNGVCLDGTPPTDEDRLRLATEFGTAGKQVVLYAGTHGYAHGVEVALGAAQELRDKRDLVFIFVGDGSEKRRLVHMAEQLGLTNVRFLPSVSPECAWRLQSISLAGLSTLRATPLSAGTRPVKALLAMAAGKPVLYSGSGEGARLVDDARAGLVTPPGDSHALAEAVRHLTTHPELAAELGMNGRRYAEQNLTWSALTKAWLDELIAKRRQ